MSKRMSFSLGVLLQLSAMFICLPAWSADLKPEEVVTKHLDSIATAQIREGVKSRVVQGPATFKMMVGGGGVLEGKGGIVSEQGKTNFVLKFTNDYRG